MLRNWLIVALRTLRRQKLFTAINVLGLAIGLAGALMIALFVRHELSYDTMFTQADRIHRFYERQYIDGRDPQISAVGNLPFGKVMAEQIEGIEAVAQLSGHREVLMIDGEPRFQSFALASPDFFKVFDLPMLAGDPATALREPFSVVLSEREALKLFGRTDALGATLTNRSGDTLKVTGVLKDPPRNMSIRADALLSLESPIRRVLSTREQWRSNWLETYVLLAPGVDPAAVEARMDAAAARLVPNYTAPRTGSFSFSLHLTPLTEIHLRPELNFRAVSPDVIAAFVGVAMLLLLIAAINFVNLTTARATMRAREVALRKTLGAGRGSLIVQYVGECALLTVVAGIIALALVELLLPAFQQMVGVTLDPAFRTQGALLALAVPMVLLMAVMGGVYPAFVLSAFRPAAVLRGGQPGGPPGGGRLRAALVVLQFAAAITLAISTWIIVDQTRYAQSARLGFDRENVVILRNAGGQLAHGQRPALLERLAREPGVVSASASGWVPTDRSERTTIYTVVDGSGTSRQMTFRTEPVDYDYLRTMGAELLAGRLFEVGREADIVPADAYTARPGETVSREASAVISRSVAAALGWGAPEAALGRTMNAGGFTVTVIGVVEDFQFGSVRAPRPPTVFLAEPSSASVLVVRVEAGALPAILERIDALWKEAYPTIPVTREFLDGEVAELYEAERRQAAVLGAFAMLAILVACLGLFGLAAFQAERRTREIGLRKVLGASIADVVRLLVWQFSRPVLVATLIAWPVAWFAMERWLEGFATRIDLTPVPFIVAGLVAMALAWLTVAGHAARVAARRPIHALRYE